MASNDRSGDSGGDRLVLLFLVVALAAVIVRSAWVCDDAYITFRSIWNLAHGYGVTWNVGERVQAFTHPLWFLLMAMWYGVTGDVYYTSIFLSIVLSLGAVLLVLMLRDSLVAGVTALSVLLFSKAFIDYTTSGLENALGYLIAASFLVVFLRLNRDLRTLSLLSLVAGLAAVNRPDTILLFLPALAYVYLGAPWGKGLGALAIGFFPTAAWEIFSVIYFGFPFPNTYYAKLGAGIPVGEQVFQGLLYVLDSVASDPVTPVTIAAGVLVAFVLRERRLIMLMLGVVVYLIYVVSVGGDFMSGRFFAAPVLISAAVLSRNRLGFGRRFGWVPLAAVAALGLSSPHPTILTDAKYGIEWGTAIPASGIADERAYYYSSTGLLNAARGREMPDHAWGKAGAAVADSGLPAARRSTIGFFGYCAGPSVRIIDSYALGDPLLARLPCDDLSRWRTGHIFRAVPLGYDSTDGPGHNRLVDTALVQVYNRLCAVIRGPLFTQERWREIWRFNTGYYDSLLWAYAHPQQERARYADVCVPMATGIPWDAAGTRRLRTPGLRIDLDSVYHNRSFEISVDHNDTYDFILYRDTAAVGKATFEKQRFRPIGLRVDTLDAPAGAYVSGYNAVEVVPVEGDFMYSFGHLRLLVGAGDEKVKP